MPHRILLVEDERPLLALLSKFLTQRGYEVTACDSGQAVLRLCEQNPQGFDLVVLDLRLPDLPGDQVLARLLELSPGLRVLISSGSVWTSAHLPEAHRGRTASILKPFMPKTLVEHIEALLA